MIDPVVASDGHSYERSCMEDWIHSFSLKGLDATSPKTNERLPHHHLIPNHTLKSGIEDFHEARRVADNATRQDCQQSNHMKAVSAVLEPPPLVSLAASKGHARQRNRATTTSKRTQATTTVALTAAETSLAVEKAVGRLAAPPPAPPAPRPSVPAVLDPMPSSQQTQSQSKSPVATYLNVAQSAVAYGEMLNVGQGQIHKVSQTKKLPKCADVDVRNQGKGKKTSSVSITTSVNSTSGTVVQQVDSSRGVVLPPAIDPVPLADGGRKSNARIPTSSVWKTKAEEIPQPLQGSAAVDEPESAHVSALVKTFRRLKQERELGLQQSVTPVAASSVASAISTETSSTAAEEAVVNITEAAPAVAACPVVLEHLPAPIPTPVATSCATLAIVLEASSTAAEEAVVHVTEEASAVEVPPVEHLSAAVAASSVTSAISTETSSTAAEEAVVNITEAAPSVAACPVVLEHLPATVAASSGDQATDAPPDVRTHSAEQETKEAAAVVAAAVAAAKVKAIQEARNKVEREAKELADKNAAAAVINAKALAEKKRMTAATAAAAEHAARPAVERAQVLQRKGKQRKAPKPSANEDEENRLLEAAQQTARPAVQPQRSANFKTLFFVIGLAVLLLTAWWCLTAPPESKKATSSDLEIYEQFAWLKKHAEKNLALTTDLEIQKDMIEELIYPIVYMEQPQFAGRITGILLELGNEDLLTLIGSPDALMSKIDEVVVVLKKDLLEMPQQTQREKVKEKGAMGTARNEEIQKKELKSMRRFLREKDIFFAAREGDLYVIKRLLKEGVDKDLVTKDGFSPLYIAAGIGHLPVVRYLLEQGADKDKTCTKGSSPLYIAANEGHLPIVQYLLEQGADMEKATNEGANPLVIATQEGHLSVVQCLVQGGAEKDKANEHGITPLMYAAEWGHLGVLRYLMEQGADKDKTNIDGRTAFMAAAVNGHLDVLFLLAEQGADKEKVDNDGWNALMYAVEGGHLTVIKSLLKDGMDIDKTANNGYTPLHAAAANGDLDILNCLLKEGANMFKTDNFGHSPADVAAYSNHGMVVDYLDKLMFIELQKLKLKKASISKKATRKRP